MSDELFIFFSASWSTQSWTSRGPPLFTNVEGGTNGRVAAAGSGPRRRRGVAEPACAKNIIPEHNIVKVLVSLPGIDVNKAGDDDRAHLLAQQTVAHLTRHRIRSLVALFSSL